MPPIVPDEEKELRGTARPSRSVVPLYPDHASRPDPDDIPPPAGMTTAAADIWRVKVDRYRQRGQKIDGVQDALRQYCEIEAKLVALWKGDGPPMSMVNAYRAFCTQFFDTPCSQRIAVGARKDDNPFSKFGA